MRFGMVVVKKKCIVSLGMQKSKNLVAGDIWGLGLPVGFCQPLLSRLQIFEPSIPGNCVIFPSVLYWGLDPPKCMGSSTFFLLSLALSYFFNLYSFSWMSLLWFLWAINVRSIEKKNGHSPTRNVRIFTVILCCGSMIEIVCYSFRFSFNESSL